MALSELQIKAHLQKLQAQDLLKRGFRVRTRAQQLLSGTAGHPKRVNSGLLRSDIGVRLRTSHGHPSVRIGSGKKYARYVHDGTGLYGPHHQLITPKSAKALVFPSKKFGAKRGKFRGKVVVRSVKGMKPNAFLRDALPAAKR